MRYEGAKNNIHFICGNPLREHLSVSVLCDMTSHEIDIFNFCFELINSFLNQKPIDDESYLNILIYDKDNVKLIFDESDVFGNCCTQAFLPIHKWRDNNFEDLKQIVCIIEEIAHGLWHIRDEFIVKETVVNVLHQLQELTHLVASDIYTADEIPKLRAVLLKHVSLT